MLSEKDIETIEGLGWRIVEDRNALELQRYTPAGEDLWVTLDEGGGSHETLVRQLDCYWGFFDIREEFMLWADSMGERGVPDDPVALIADQYWKCARLGELYHALAHGDPSLCDPQWSKAYEALSSVTA